MEHPIKSYLDAYEAIPGWDTLRTQRMPEIVDMALAGASGDILEIGAHQGLTTVELCRVGKKYDRHVYVIDPWDGRQEGNGKVMENFNDNTRHHSNLTVHKVGSEALGPMRQFIDDKTRFAFVLIDGLHTYGAVQNDIEKYAALLTDNSILCIDDWRGPYGFSAKIREAAADHLDESFTCLEAPDSFIEQYFVRRQ